LSAEVKRCITPLIDIPPVDLDHKTMSPNKVDPMSSTVLPVS
jgi:hypothetical protein